MNSSIKGKLKFIIPVFLLLAAAVSIYGIMASSVSAAKGTILKGIHINNVDIGGMTKEDALKKLDNHFNEKLRNVTLNIKYENKNWQLGYKELNAKYDVERAVEEAYKISEDSSFITKALISMGINKETKNIPISFSYDKAKIDEKINAIAKEVKKDPVDAKYSFNGSRLIAAPEVSGIELDKQKLMSMLNDAIKPDGQNMTIDAPINKINASKTAEMFNAVNTKLSSFSTQFSTADANRTSNLKVGAQAVNGTVVMPGEVFSLNKEMGPRIASNGYKEAPVIVDGELVPGLGGGVCQVASTLYNAVLLADLDIVERRNHTLVSSYIDKGRDATISGDYIDFKFRNNRKYPIYIQSYLSGNKIYFNIFGDNSTPNMKVVITTDVYETIQPTPKVTIDPNMPEGQEVIKSKPKPGYKVKTYRKTYIDGKLVRDENLGISHYRVVNGEIIKGGKKVTSTVTQPVPASTPAQDSATEEPQD